VVQADNGDSLKVKFGDRYEWVVNVCACELVDAADLGFIHAGPVIARSLYTRSPASADGPRDALCLSKSGARFIKYLTIYRKIIVSLS